MKRLNERPLMFISYYHGQSGGVMSEWAEDKLRVLKVQNRRTLLITSVLSSEQDEDVLHHSRVPSLSYRDYCSESKVKSSVSILNRRGSHYRYLLASSLGRFFDIVTKKYVSNTSNAMWSWAFACIPKALFYYFRFGARDVFATGGATGGHLLALLISYLPNTNIYLEFQDPLFGAEMPRTKHNERGILRLERLMIERSKKTVFVTKTAAYEAQERHMLHAGKVAAVYPGAWDFFPTLDHLIRDLREH